MLSEYAYAINSKGVEDIDKYCRLEGIDRQYLEVSLMKQRNDSSSGAAKKSWFINGIVGLNILSRMKSRA